MARAQKLERIHIPEQSRAIKDWFPTRESAEAMIPAILAHIKTTGQTHTCPCHTHTKPSRDAVPVYIAEFSLPERFRKAKRFAPCPCCWEEFGKFGHGMIAWFPSERVIRLLGPDCFASLNPEAHRQARSVFEEEQRRRRDTNFLIANVGKIPEVIAVIQRALPVARAIEQLHTLLHDRFRTLGIRLSFVGHNGELPITEQTQEFRRDARGEMETHDTEVTRAYATISGHRMTESRRLHLSNVLERCLERLREHNYGTDWQARIEQMSDGRREKAADELSKVVKVAKDVIAKIVELRRFAEPVTINTLRAWGQHPGCPMPFNYAHNGNSILFGPSDFRMVGVPLSPDLQTHIGEIDFWTEIERRNRP